MSPLKSPLKITHVSGGTLTGCTSVVLRLLEHHDRKLVSPSVCFFAVKGADPSVRRRADELSVPWRDVVKQSRYEAASVVRLARALKDLGSQAVVLHGFGAYSFGTPAARMARIPVVVRVEHNPELYGRLHVAASRLTARFTDSTILVSRYLQSYLEERGVRLPSPEVVYNGIDLTQVPTARRPVRSENETAVAIMAARLDVQKDHTSLIQAVALLKEKGIALRLRLVGEGPLEGALREQTRQLGIADRVEFLGFRRDMNALLEAADMAILSTNYEGFGLVVAEAMAMGLPVVATRVSSLPELIDERTGILVAPKSPGAIADALESLIRNPAQRGKMGDAGRAKVMEKFALVPSVRAFERHVLATAARLIPSTRRG